MSFLLLCSEKRTFLNRNYYGSIEEIMNLMNLGNKKVNKMLKELEKHGLIYRRHQGLGRPNKIYVYDLLKADNSNWLPKQIMFGKGSSNEKEVL